MLETHPFKPYIPPNARILLLGSFTGRADIGSDKGKAHRSFDWYYGSRRNQFWPILRTVYRTNLETKAEKTALFDALHMAITDIILKCERKANSNLDTNLSKIVYNKRAIRKILSENEIRTIYFTSKYVESTFKKIFRFEGLDHSDINQLSLPSPSPRYASMSLHEKIRVYSKLLPKLRRKTARQRGCRIGK